MIKIADGLYEAIMELHLMRLKQPYAHYSIGKLNGKWKVHKR